jgi:hypothetical protein
VELTSAQINLSWFCDFHANPRTACPYCWVTEAHPDRTRKGNRSADEWARAIAAHIAPTAVVDFVGGEPTVFPGFHELVTRVSATHRWAVTSNMGGTRWRLYCERPVPNCLSWTASYHPSGSPSIQEFGRSCRAVSRHYPTQVNLVDHPSFDARSAVATLRDILADRGMSVVLSPYEEVRDLDVAGPTPLVCSGGMVHVSIDPEGHVYRCLSHERRADRERFRIGNLFGQGIERPERSAICFVPCDVFYVLRTKHTTPNLWNLSVRELELPDGVDLSAHRASFRPPARPAAAGDHS